MNSGIRGSGKWEQEGSRSGRSVVPVLTKSITRVWSCDCILPQTSTSVTGWVYKGNRDSVYGRELVVKYKTAWTLVEGPMGKASGSPTKKETASQWLAIGTSAHPQNGGRYQYHNEKEKKFNQM